MSRTMRWIICVLSMYLITAGVVFGRTTSQQANASEKAFVSEKANPSETVNRGEKVKIEGVVISRQRDILTMRTADSQNVQVAFTDYTRVVTPDGLLGKKQMPVSDLVPGLWIKVQGVGDSPGHVLAESVSFSNKDLRTAHAIQGGLVPLETRVQTDERQIQTNVQNIQTNQQQIQTNQQQTQANQQQIGEANQRLSELTDYDVKNTVSVNFPVGSAVLSPQARSEVLRLARNAVALKGYFIQVKGFTDSSGAIGQNQELSMSRALSVIACLEEEGNIPLTHILTPGALGETQPVSTNETSVGRAENRRVEIKVLVSRGIAGP
jgi:outer membrane protein OmpA-like peptidoglycan-associated protein